LTLQAEIHRVFESTKTYDHSAGFSVAFRQWRADSHCHFLHGYALRIHFKFSALELDSRRWVVDFGGLKPLKAVLEESLDHKTMVAVDDPNIEWFRQGHQLGVLDLVEVDNTGCEATAQLIFLVAEQWLLDAGYGTRVQLEMVEVSEHSGNSAIYRRAL
jgi:6-pyruvoyltetrahydropterin/6-carboxytetrahydropterin synthase